MVSVGRLLIGTFLAAICAPLMVGAGMSIQLLGPHFSVSLVLTIMTFALLYGITYALVAAFVVALPAYTLLSTRRPMRWWHASLAGAIIGVLPPLLLREFGSLATFAAAGLLSGLVFRAVIGSDPRLVEPAIVADGEAV